MSLEILWARHVAALQDDPDYCGTLSPNGKRVCIKPNAHDGKHDWENDEDES